MMPRYTPQEIGDVWTDKEKFQLWYVVEMAIIQARCELGLYPTEIYELIKKTASFTTTAIEKREEKIEHDLQAFVETLRETVTMALRRYIHDGVTSYDIEDPALALMFLHAGRIIIDDLQRLITTLRLRASEHMHTYCMGMTHGRDAKPTPFGWRLCMYLEMMERGLKNFEYILEQVKEVKCSGATGNYATISPALESKVCGLLGLRVRPVASQIVGRDVYARALSEIAVIGGCLEKIAEDLRLLSLSGIDEIIEPKKTTSKGSSAMPQKVNPVKLEQISGLVRILRGNALAMMETISTWLERDIANSSVERIVLADSTILIDYLLISMEAIITGMTVRREQMSVNIHRACDTWAAEDVKIFLCGKELDPDAVYTFLQACATKAHELKHNYKEVLLASIYLPKGAPLREIIDPQELIGCFDFISKLRNLEEGYRRMNLDPKLALPSNIK